LPRELQPPKKNEHATRAGKPQKTETAERRRQRAYVRLKRGRSPSNAASKMRLSIAPPSARAARSRSSRSGQSGYGLGFAVGMKGAGELTEGRSRARWCHGACVAL
jgi:hypothetical protein